MEFLDKGCHLKEVYVGWNDPKWININFIVIILKSP